MFLPKTISVLRIVEYSTISMLGYFEDTLSNVGLPEAWLEWELYGVTQIENKCGKRETNQIEKRSQMSWTELKSRSQTKSGEESSWYQKVKSSQKLQVELNPVVTGESNQVGTGGQRKTANADDGAWVVWRSQQWAGSWCSGVAFAVDDNCDAANDCRRIRRIRPRSGCIGQDPM